MMRTATLLLALLPAAAATEDATPRPSAREALEGFNDLIGTWKGTGTPGRRNQPEGGREDGLWVETIRWRWQFKGKDGWLVADVEKGKHFTRFELRYRPGSDDYALTATTADKRTLTFTGKRAGRRLAVDRTDGKSKQTQRLVFSLLHANRHLVTAETRAAGVTSFTRLYQVGATKQGVAFATEDAGPECVVSGGLGTMRVEFKGTTYFVCCTGCRDAFKEDPEKYVKEFEARKKKKK